jgi:hypothetical protein
VLPVPDPSSVSLELPQASPVQTPVTNHEAELREASPTLLEAAGHAGARTAVEAAGAAAAASTGEAERQGAAESEDEDSDDDGLAPNIF